jgi:hypothetical protein
MPEQELSIKEREEELFVEPAEALPPKPPLKPFLRYLQETPAKPMSTEAKVILWVVGIAVLLLFVAALWRTHRSARPRPRSGTPKTAAIRPALRVDSKGREPIPPAVETGLDGRRDGPFLLGLIPFPGPPT